MVGLLLLLSSLIALPLLGDMFSAQPTADDENTAGRDGTQETGPKERVEVRGGNGSGAVFGANIYAAIDEDIYGGDGSDAL